MGLSTELGKFVGSGVGTLAREVADIIGQFVETEEEKKAAEALLMKIQQEPDKWQAEINKIEAGHRTVFVAGWRPFIGWVCGTGLAIEFIVSPLIEWVVKLLGRVITRPELDISTLVALVTSLLGLGAARTYEKMKGLTK